MRCDYGFTLCTNHPPPFRHCEANRRFAEAIQKNKKPCHTERSEVSKSRESKKQIKSMAQKRIDKSDQRFA